MRRVAVWRFGSAMAALLLCGCALRRMEHTAIRSVTVPVAGATTLVLDAGAGYLRVEGNSATAEIAVTGIARADSPITLNAIQFTTRRAADTVFVSCTIPASPNSPGPGPAFDVTVRLPRGIALSVVDSVGDATFHNVGALRLVHGDGSLNVDSVAGDLDVHDGDGDMVIANVNGDVHIIDGAGSIHVDGVRGSVLIPRDGSGEIHLGDITGDVTVGTKQSGEVAVREVGGHLAITANGSGSVEYYNVRGRVSIPPGR